MSKTKVKELPFSTTTEYEEFHPTETPDLKAYREFADKPESIEPALQAQYDRASQTAANRLRSSYNQNIPQEAREAMLENNQRNLTADYGAAINQSAYDAYDRNLQRRQNLAEMTLGKPLQKKTYGYNSQIQQGTWGQILGSAIQGGAAVGAAFA